MRRLRTPLALLLLCLALPLAPALALTINVDGNSADWANVPALTPVDGDDATPNGLDINNVYYTNSATTLYLRYDTIGDTAWTNPTFICFNTEDSTGGNQQSPAGCGGPSNPLTNIDYRLTISGPKNNLTTQLFACNNGSQCPQEVKDSGLRAASVGTVTEVAVPLDAIDVISPGINGAFDFSISTDGGSGPNSDFVRYDNRSLPSPTPVTLTELTAARADGGVRVAWGTATEFEVVGFHVLRSDTGERAGAAAITPELIAAEGDRVTGASYAFLDAAPPGDAPARYWLEVWNADGSRDEYGPVSAAPLVGDDAGTSIYLPLLAR